MAERSAAALHWVVVTLVLWGITCLIPPTGTRRKATPSTRMVVTSETPRGHADRRVRVQAVRRSPYSTDQGPLDGSASRLSRPYLPALADSVPELESEAVAARRTARVRRNGAARARAVRLRRREVAVLAADFGFHFGIRDIHAESDAVMAR
ncbi:hypothetical protein OG241_34275 [Streptomyces sp. NBC_01390]|uniref:hypothetical protein n=1 Tax=Streptomyces sp. NBC_01390 TaxID=2903850 RepID=UPI00324456B8